MKRHKKWLSLLLVGILTLQTGASVFAQTNEGSGIVEETEVEETVGEEKTSLEETELEEIASEDQVQDVVEDKETPAPIDEDNPLGNTEEYLNGEDLEGVDPEWAEVSASKKVTLTMEGTSSNDTFGEEIPYDEEWFQLDSSAYNNNLSILSICLSNIAYGYNAVTPPNNGKTEDLVYNNLAKLGFAKKNIYTYYTLDYDKDSDHQVAYAFATKKITVDGKRVDLVYALIRGTNSNREWISNFDIDDTNEGESHVNYHEGFRIAEQKVKAALDQFLTEQKITKSSAKFLVTGHSRGAAVANLLGAELDEEAAKANEGSVKKENIYTYTFATPSTTGRTNINQDTYANIFNILNPEDLVKDVPFNGGNWYFTKFGKNLVLPSASNTKDYDSKKTIMNKYFSKMTGGTEYQPFWKGTFLSNTVTWTLTKVMFMGVPSYYWPWSIGGAIKSWFKTDSVTKVGQVQGIIEIINNIKIIHYLITMTGWDDFYSQALNCMHETETYLSWLFAANETDIFSSGKMKMVSVPANQAVNLLDENGETLIAVQDGEISYQEGEDSVVAAIIVDTKVTVDEDGNVVESEALSDKTLLIQVPEFENCQLMLFGSENSEDASNAQLTIETYDVEFQLEDTLQLSNEEIPDGADILINLSGSNQETGVLTTMLLGNISLKEESSISYDGNAKTPEVVVSSGAMILAEGSDYELTYTNNINAGVATVTAKGIGGCQGEVNTTFTILPQEIKDGDMKKVTIADIPNQKVTGKPITPELSIKDGDKQLLLATDYDVAYENNEKAGTAKANITFKGNYTGILTKTFIITAVSSGSGTNNNNSNNSGSNTNSGSTTTTSAKTGDMTNSAIWIVFASIGMIAAIFSTVTIVIKKKRKN